MREEIQLTVNGQTRALCVEGERNLLDCLRNELGLTGAKYGCGEGQCGACAVLVDGQAIPSCVTPVSAAVGKAVTTIEGLALDGALHPVQQAFLRHEAFQCGFCTPGMIVATAALLRSNPRPTEAEIRQALEIHLCRCCTYPRILAAIRDAANEGVGGWGLGVGEGDAPRPTSYLQPLTPDPQPPSGEVSRLTIGEDGSVTVFTGKVEVGQGSRTELTQVAAEALGLPPERVHLVMADTARVPDDGGTSGSRTTPSTVPQVRAAAEAARARLAETTEGVKGRRGEGVIEDRRPASARIDTPSPLHPFTPSPLQSLPRVGARALVTGAHGYASDLRRPGMLFGKVVRPPAFGARLLAADIRAAESIPGVVVVREGDFLGVAAASAWEAGQAATAIRARWEVPSAPSSAELFDYLKSHPMEGEGWGQRSQGSSEGSVEEGLAMAEHRLEATYTVAYIAHAPLEPRAAVAEWESDRLTVWTGTQQPFGVREELAGAFGIASERVRVIVPDTGSGYGGKHRGDAAVEAARLARAAGRPVKVVWTREEEFTWAYFRPAGLIEIRSGATANGKLVAWEMRNYNSGGSAVTSPWYDIPHVRTAFQPCAAPLRHGAYRALAATANHFARESHLDEVAVAVGVDPLAFRLWHLRDERLRAVLEATAVRFGWAERQVTPGRGFGMACGFEKGSYVATCVEVEADSASGLVRVIRVTEGFECGAVINEENLRNQIEGAILQGMGGALREEIRFENGRILNPAFTAYRVPRFSDLCPIEVVLIDRTDLPSAGAGETPIVGIAPAIANALFQATGKRIRKMPLCGTG